MTNHRVGKTNTRDPRGGWRTGKEYKGKRGWAGTTNRAIRRLSRALERGWEDE
jgi:hypothetical protein